MYSGDFFKNLKGKRKCERAWDKEFTLAQQLRNILAMEQEHAMDLKQALGK